MSLSAGALIWISVRPLIRLYVLNINPHAIDHDSFLHSAAGVASGFIITKADIFPPVASRGAGQIALNITLPALLFSKLVPAFNTDNVKAIGWPDAFKNDIDPEIQTGPLALVALLYELMGVALAWIVRKFFWVPHRFRYGILIAGGWGNVGDVCAVRCSMWSRFTSQIRVSSHRSNTQHYCGCPLQRNI
jgi:hypothetical protein